MISFLMLAWGGIAPADTYTFQLAISLFVRETPPEVIWKTLDRIRSRDGIKIFKEVADRIANSVAVSIENGKKRERSSTSR